MEFLSRRLSLSLLCFVVLIHGIRPAYGGEPYGVRLADRCDAWREQLPAMAGSAARAAKGVIGGGNLYAFGPQPGFASEACGRAGGLMMVKHYTANITLTENDTVLAALAGFENDAARASLKQLLGRAEQAGAQVVLFTLADFEHRVEHTALTVLPRGSLIAAKGMSIESVSNVIGMWAWTGEFIAACVERGKMPCVYQSYRLPGGRERGAHLAQHNNARFHAESKVLLADAQHIARDFIGTIQQALRNVAVVNDDAFKQAATLLRAIHERGEVVTIHTMGHMYPAEFNQPQQPDWIVHTSQTTADMNISGAIALFYQEFPWETVDSIIAKKQVCIVTCAQPAAPDFTADPNHVYLDPSWTLYDSAVELNNYDVRLLPASGIMDTAVYWQLIEQLD